MNDVYFKTFTFQIFVGDTVVCEGHDFKLSDIDTLLSEFHFENCDIVITSEEETK